MWLDLKDAQNDCVEGIDVDQAYTDISNFCSNWTATNLMNQGGGGDSPIYRLIDEVVLPIPKFKRIETRVRYEFSNGKFKSFFEAESECGEFFEHVFAKYVNKLEKSSNVRMFIQHPLFDNPINTEWLAKEQFTSSVVYKSFYETLQSKKKLG
jgi:hypothetical protein